MKYLIFPLVLILIVVAFSACSTAKKLEIIKPEPDNAAPLVYETTTSFLKLPVSIKLKDVENQTNKLLNGMIYNDSIMNDDDIIMRVWKQAPIKIESEKEGNITKIKTTLPLKINATYRYGFDKMGIKLYDTKEFNLNGIVTLLSEVDLTNWQLKTNTKIKSLDWTESPTVTIAGKNIPITYLINPTIRIFKSKIEKGIDDSIKESLNFKPQVLEALDKIATPFEMSEEYASWLRIVPIELYVTDAILKKDAIAMDMGLKCSMETIIGKKPEKNSTKAK